MLHWLLEAVVYCLWLPAIALFVMRRWRLRAGLLLVPGVITLAFCLIGPVFDARYCLPLLYTTPLLMGMLCCLIRARTQAEPQIQAEPQPQPQQPRLQSRPQLQSQSKAEPQQPPQQGAACER